MKDLSSARNFLRLNENSGKEPYRKVYKDHKNIPTISTGFNLFRQDAEKVITSVGADFNAIIDGTAELTLEQSLQVEQFILEEAESIIVRKIGSDTFNNLGANQQVSLVSLCVNSPSLIGPNLTKLLQSGKHLEVVDEIRQRSNAKNNPGIQNRRDREADMFKKDILELKASATAKEEGNDDKDDQDSSKSDIQLNSEERENSEDILKIVNAQLDQLFHNYMKAALSLANITSYKDRTLKLHIPKKMHIKGLPFKKQDAYFDSLDFEIKHDDSYTPISTRISSTFVLFEKRRFPVVVSTDQFAKLLQKNASDLSLPEFGKQTFNFDTALSSLPALRFSLPNINLSELSVFEKFPNVAMNLKKIPGINLDSLLKDLHIIIEPKNYLFSMSTKLPDGIVNLCLKEVNNAQHCAVKLSGIRTHGELANLVDKITVCYASMDIPLLGIKAGLGITATIDLTHSGLPAIKKAAQLGGLKGPSIISITLLETGYQFSLSAPESHIKLGALEMRNLKFTFDSTNQRMSISGYAKITYSDRHLELQGELILSPDGSVSGRLKLDNGQEIYLSALNMYMHDMSVVIKPAVDQGMKIGFAGKLTLKQKNQCQREDIGEIQFLPGSGLLNSDFSAEFPREFRLSLSQSISLVARQQVSLPKLLDPIEYLGYEREGNFHPLTIAYLPSEMNFRVKAAVNFFGHKALLSELAVRPSGVHLYIEFPRIHEKKYFILEHTKDPQKGPVISANLPSPSALGAANLSDTSVSIAARLKLFGLEQTVDANLSNEELSVKLSTGVQLIPQLKTHAAGELWFNFQKRCFRLNAEAEQRVKLSISHKNIGKMDIASATAKLGIKIDSNDKNIEVNGSFRAGIEKVTFRINVNLSDIANLHMLIQEAANSAAQNMVNGKYEKDIREWLKKLDPTNEPTVRKAIDEANEYFRKIDEERLAAQALIARKEREAREHAARKEREAREHAARKEREAREHAAKKEREAREHAAKKEREAREHAAKKEREAREHAQKKVNEAGRHIAKRMGW